MWLLMERRDWSQSDLRRALGVGTGVVPRWLYGDTRPSLDEAVKLHDKFKIPVRAWTLEPAASFVPPAVRAALGSGPLPAVDSTGTDDE